MVCIRHARAYVCVGAVRAGMHTDGAPPASSPLPFIPLVPPRGTKGISSHEGAIFRRRSHLPPVNDFVPSAATTTSHADDVAPGERRPGESQTGPLARSPSVFDYFHFSRRFASYAQAKHENFQRLSTLVNAQAADIGRTMYPLPQHRRDTSPVLRAIRRAVTTIVGAPTIRGCARATSHEGDLRNGKRVQGSRIARGDSQVTQAYRHLIGAPVETWGSLTE